MSQDTYVDGAINMDRPGVRWPHGLGIVEDCKVDGWAADSRCIQI